MPVAADLRRLLYRSFPLALAVCVSWAASGGPAHAADLASAERQLNHGEADHALTSLRALLSADPHNGSANLLLCRVYYALEQPDNAVAACESAAASLHTAAAQDWMGRAYGRKAEEYGPLSGLAYARRVRQAFEAANALDPRDGASANDLSEFYINAPAVIGGGLDKARALADRSAAALPQNAHRMRAMPAEKASDNAAAEREFRAAAAVANQPTAWADLGDFYGRRHQFPQALDALAHAVAADRKADSVLVDCADILISLHQRGDLAEQWLTAYLAGASQTDAAPAFRVRLELAKLLVRRHDRAAARIQLNQALALASTYEPAKKELRSL